MALIELLFQIITAVGTIFAIYFGIRNIHYRRQADAQQKLIEDIKRFDEPQALILLKRARAHDHNSWVLWYQKLRLLAEESGSSDFRLIDAASDASSRYTEAHEILRDMVRVYKLSGGQITNQVYDRWVAEGWVPDHYRDMFVG
jgi:hypothetical protein